MATRLVPGQRSWSGGRNAEGHREWKIKHRTEGAPTDGPANHLQTPGLPTPGSVWIVDDDVDLWAYCTLAATVTPVVENEKNKFFDVEQTFSTRPSKRCQEEQYEDPLMEPMKLSGSFVKYNEEATHDRFGAPILTSSHEMIRGPQVEFDRNRPQVKIEQNVAVLDLAAAAAMVDTLNDRYMWGFPPRCIKLSDFHWEEKYHGQCSVYYTRSFTFDINAEGFDRNVLDEGTKVLHGHWGGEGTWIVDDVGVDEFDVPIPADPRDPTHFDRFTDRQGNPARVILNGSGLPAGVDIGTSVGDFYVSIKSNNTTSPPYGVSSWVKTSGGGVSEAWSADTIYYRGALVNITTPGGLVSQSDYICTKDQGWNGMNPQWSEGWVEIPGGVASVGDWDGEGVYAKGDVVNYLDTQQTSVGSINVQKYGESNLLSLGIPATIG